MEILQSMLGLHMGESASRQSSRTQQFHLAADHMDSWASLEEATYLLALAYFKIIKKAERFDNHKWLIREELKRLLQMSQLWILKLKPELSMVDNSSGIQIKSGIRSMKVVARRQGLILQQLSAALLWLKGYGRVESKQRELPMMFDMRVIFAISQWIKCLLLSSSDFVFELYQGDWSLPRSKFSKLQGVKSQYDNLQLPSVISPTLNRLCAYCPLVIPM